MNETWKTKQCYNNVRHSLRPEFLLSVSVHNVSIVYFSLSLNTCSRILKNKYVNGIMHFFESWMI